MATHASGRLPEFNGTSWGSWFGRLQFFFEANNITDPSKKKAHLLTLCGEETYDTVCSLVQPSTPAAVGYDDIVAALQKHYDPRPSEVYSRARFQRRDQMEGEAVSAYVAALKKTGRRLQLRNAAHHNGSYRTPSRNATCEPYHATTGRYAP